MKLGVAYYPEHRGPARWATDYARARAAGIRRVRVGEFAWSRIEPQPGFYNWEWLDRSIDQAARGGIEVVLCTPTACPPIWLVERYPEVLPVDRSGRRTGFGARQHRCYNAPAYVAHSARIVEALGERYGAHPNVVAWQLDNEFGGECKRCYCDHCRRAFQADLARRYGTIEALNERWGTVFWSQEYQRWDQVPVPLQHAADLHMRHHPSLELAFSRFSSASIVRHCRMQADLLRKHTGARPITTNAFLFKWGDNLDWYELFAGLDAAGIDIYSQRPHEIAFYLDFAHSLVPGAAWVMEYGTRSRNLRAEMDLLAARGCDWLFFFKLNPFPWGQEQGIENLLTITGEPGANYDAVREWANEWDTERHRQDTAIHRAGRGERVSDEAEPPRAGRARVGLVYDFSSSWAHAIGLWDRPLQETWAYSRYLIDTVYRALFEVGLPARILSPAEALDGLDVLLLPRLILHDPGLERRLIEWVKNGGALIATNDLFRKNADNVYLEEVPEIYRALYDWRENAYIDRGALGEDAVRQHRAGQGTAWMLPADAEVADWARVLDRAIASPL